MTSQPENTQQQVDGGDIQSRIENFNKELLPLLGKYELGLGAQVGLTPDGRLQAQPVIVNVRGRTDLPQNQPQAKSEDAGLSKVE